MRLQTATPPIRSQSLTVTLTCRDIKNLGDLTGTRDITRSKVSKEKMEMNDWQPPATLGLELSPFLAASSLATTLSGEDTRSKGQCSSKGWRFSFPAGSVHRLREHLNPPAQGFELIVGEACGLPSMCLQLKGEISHPVTLI